MSTPEQHRERRKRAALAQGRTIRAYKPRDIQATTPQEWRREYKRLQRREQGAKLRTEIAAEAKAKREAMELTKAAEAQAKQLSKHDAHVKRYAKVLSDRAKYAKRYKENPQAERQRTAQRKQLLPDAYVIQQLKSCGIPREIVTPEVIGLKRECMQYRRLSRNIKSTVKNHLKEQNETITKHP